MIPSLQNHFERIEEVRASLWARAENLDDERFNRKPPDGGWSVSQVFSHLMKAEALSLAYIQKKIAKPEAVGKAGIGAAFRTWALTLALRSGLKFKAPARSAEVPEHQDLETSRREWDEIRAGWRATLESYPPELAGLAIFRHPRAGMMTVEQTLTFIDEHMQHHAKQVERILAATA